MTILNAVVKVVKRSRNPIGPVEIHRRAKRVFGHSIKPKTVRGLLSRMALTRGAALKRVGRGRYRAA